MLRQGTESQLDGEGDGGGGDGDGGGRDGLVTAETHVPRLARCDSYRFQHPLGGLWQRQPEKV